MPDKACSSCCCSELPYPQACLLGARPQCLKREQLQMPRYFEATPRFVEVPVAHTFYIRGYHNQPSALTENAIAFSEATNRVRHMLNHVIHRNDVETAFRKPSALQRAGCDVQVEHAMSDISSCGIRLHTHYLPP